MNGILLTKHEEENVWGASHLKYGYYVTFYHESAQVAAKECYNHSRRMIEAHKN